MDSPVSTPERAHAKLSASGSHRWMSCTASAWAESFFEDTTTEFAEEGTRAHRMGGECLERDINAADWALDERVMADDPEEFDELYPDEMQEYVQGYIDFVRDFIADHNEDIVIVETRVDFSDWVPEGFGTLDAAVVIVTNKHAYVIDLKYGKGVMVSAFENSQGLLYALGLVKRFPWLETITMFIYQPRVHNVSRFDVRVSQLLEWAEHTVKPVAAIAYQPLVTGDLGDAEFKPSDEACQFCKARVHCRARKEMMIAMVSYEFAAPHLMTDEEVAEVLPEAEHLMAWGSDLKKWARESAVKGHRIEGYKLVEGRSNRKCSDEPRVAFTLRLEGYTDEQIYKPKKLRGITELTALAKGAKKLEAMIGRFIEKPRGKPVLVPITDPRPEIDRAEGFDDAATAAGFD